MPNIATVLKEEIARIARKEIKTETDSLKKANSRYRSEISELKRRITDLERQLKTVHRTAGLSTKATPVQETPADAGKVRFSAAGFKKLRTRLDISAATLAEILGTSLQTIYNWETGKTRPRHDQIVKIAHLRTMGKREVHERLQAMKG